MIIKRLVIFISLWWNWILDNLSNLYKIIGLVMFGVGFVGDVFFLRLLLNKIFFFKMLIWRRKWRWKMRGKLKFKKLRKGNVCLLD